MSEIIKQRPNILDYQTFVASSRTKGIDDENWKNIYSTLLKDELLEVFYQHGNGSKLLMPSGWFRSEEKNEDDEINYHMADELGDILWFSSDCAIRLGFSVIDACKKSVLVNNLTANQPVLSFMDIETAALLNAKKIRVPNNSGLMLQNIPEEFRITSLSDNPFYVFIRLISRLGKILNNGQVDSGPSTATDFEPIQDAAEVIGSIIFSISYIAKNRLGISIEDIARFNIAKLKNRQSYGKENDIVLNLDFLTNK